MYQTPYKIIFWIILGWKWPPGVCVFVKKENLLVVIVGLLVAKLDIKRGMIVIRCLISKFKLIYWAKPIQVPWHGERFI